MGITLNGGVLDFDSKPSLQIGSKPVWRMPVELNGKMIYGVNINGYDYPPCDTGCVLYYPGLPGQGSTIWDRSNGGNNGTITGAVWTRRPRGLGALDYDGIDDTVTVTSSASLQLTNSLSILCWAYVDALKTYNTLVTKLTAWSQGYWFQITATGIQFQWADSVLGGTGAGSDSITNNAATWYLFGVVKDGQDVLYYRNGAKVGNTKTTAGGTILTGNTNLQIGGNQASHSADFYDGKIILVRIFKDAALTAAQMAGYFNRERPLIGV